MKLLKEIAAVMIAAASVIGLTGIIYILYSALYSVKLFRYLFIGVALITLIAGLSVIIYQWLER